MASMDTESIGSTLSVFSTDEYRKLRTEIAFDGKLEVMCSSTQSSSTKHDFQTYDCVLTKDGRLAISLPTDTHKPRKYLIEECVLLDMDDTFRLKVTSESDLSSTVDELLCKCSNDLLKTRWLISIESCLRRHLTNMFNEMDCIRGNLKVTYYDSYREYDLQKDLKKCLCFYYHGVFRVKGLDLRGTLSLNVKKVIFDLGPYPSSFVINAQDCDILCYCEDVDMFTLWKLNLRKDFPGEQEKKAALEEFSGELILKTDEIGFTRMKCSFHKKNRILTLIDLAGAAKTYSVSRCGLTPPRNKSDHQFAILTKDLEKNQNANLYCQAADDFEAAKWVEVMSPSIEEVRKLIKIIVVEIEVRRIFHHESSRTEPAKPITYAEISHMASIVETQDTDLTDHDEWTVSKLERAVQLSFKILPEPLIPYELQEKFNEIGQVMRKEKSPFETHRKRVLEIIDRLPPINLDILHTMGGHVTRLVAHYNQVHAAKNKAASERNTDLTVWKRLSKYMLKVPDQIMTQKEEQDLLKNTAYVLDSLKKHSEDKMKAMKSGRPSRAGSRKSFCKQQ